MIDNIKIHLTCRDIKLEHSDWRRINRHETNGSIATYKHCNNIKYPHPLWLKIDHTKHTVTVLGSLRKWYFGSETLLDFDKKSFMIAILKLAKSLRISPYDLAKATFTKCEVGMNVTTNEYPVNILPKIVAYKRFKKDATYLSKGTLYFGSNNSSRLIVIYDKKKQIYDNNSKRRKSMIEFYSLIQPQTKNFAIRIEIRMHDHKSWQELKFGYIETIGDLYANWANLYELFVHEVSNIVFYSGIDFTRINKPNDFTLAKCIDGLGFQNAIEELCKRSNARTSHGIKTARHKRLKQVLYVIRKFRNRNAYGEFKFKCDITRCLVRKSKTEDIGLLFLSKTLWNKPYL